MGQLNIANAQGVPIMVLFLFVIVGLFLGVLSFTFKGSVQI